MLTMFFYSYFDCPIRLMPIFNRHPMSFGRIVPRNHHQNKKQTRQSKNKKHNKTKTKTKTKQNQNKTKKNKSKKQANKNKNKNKQKQNKTKQNKTTENKQNKSKQNKTKAWLTSTIVMMMKGNTCSFRKIPFQVQVYYCYHNFHKVDTTYKYIRYRPFSHYGDLPG